MIFNIAKSTTIAVAQIGCSYSDCRNVGGREFFIYTYVWELGSGRVDEKDRNPIIK